MDYKCSKNAPAQNVAAAFPRVEAASAGACALRPTEWRKAEVGGQYVAKILAIALNRDFNHPMIHSAQDLFFFTVTCAFSRIDTNVARVSFILETYTESE